MIAMCSGYFKSVFVLILLLAADLCSYRKVEGQFFAAQAPQQDLVSMFAFNGLGDEHIRKQLHGEAEQYVRFVDAVASLNEGQKKKLKVAADTDVRRFFREVDSVREDLKKQGIDQHNINEAWQIIMPLQTKIQQGVFNQGSLFDRVIQSTLTNRQETAFRDEVQRRRERRWDVLTRSNLVAIEQASMPLTREQREKLLKILLTIELPTKLDKQMDVYAGYLRLLLVEERDVELKEFLTAKQMKVIEKYRDRYRGWERMLEQ